MQSIIDLACETYPFGTLRDYIYADIISFHFGRWIFSKHKERTTWEPQGGHIEQGETPLEAAKRELFEESGAVDFDMQPLCDYRVGGTRNGVDVSGNGQVFIANVRLLTDIPGDSEMEMIGLFDSPPDNLTYPHYLREIFPLAIEKKAGLFSYPALNPPPLTGDIETDALAFLRANGKASIARHVLAVAQTAQTLAERFGLDVGIARTAALLRDIAGVMPPADMLQYARDYAWPLDASEQQHPFLLHQRISRDMARELFGINDETVLSMIACHTTLKAHATDEQMLLFIADKLSWDQDGTPPFYDCVWHALDASLAHAARAYIHYVLDHGMILSPHAWLIEAKDDLDATL